MGETLSEKAYNIIKEKLLHTEKGSYLSIRKVAEEINMSYTPVREAFLRLHKEGFLELVPRVGFFANAISLDEILQIYEVRECVELFVLRKVFYSIDETHIELMKKYLEKQKRCLQNNQIYDFVKADQKFHEVLIDLYNNKYITELYKNVREQYYICSKNIAEGVSDAAIVEHGELLKFIEKKDLEKALEALNMHIQNAKERVKIGYRRFK
ncbi:MAG: GntR family transcriptional regulator [Thermosediminibacteraceae bacterium]|nr:GntR family transcriptional regulator [Thermosediminibacteraceae bacterium]